MDTDFGEQDFLDVHLELMRIPAPSNDEGRRAEFIQEQLAEWSIDSRQDDVGNVLVDFGDTSSPETVIFDAHIDVVEKGYCEDPRVCDERISGIGSGDDLVAVAMLMLLARELKIMNLPRPLQIVFTVGEEGQGNLRGVRQLVQDRQTPPRLFVSFDLSYNSYTVCGVGSNRYQVDIECAGGHSWNDFGSPNAVELATDFLAGLKKRYQALTAETEDLITYNIGSISGGTGINSIARTSTFQFEFRSAFPELLESIDQQVSELSTRFDQDDYRFSVKSIGKRPAAQSVNEESVHSLILPMWKEEGIEPGCDPRSTNINITLAAGWPSVCVGVCISHNNHREDEYVERASLPIGWRLLQRLTKKLVLS